MSKQKSEIMIITAPCWKCDKDMLVALVGDDNGNLEYGPESFSANEIDLADKNSVHLSKVDSKTANESYLANTCAACGAFVGKWFYFANYYTEALHGYLPYKRVQD